MHVIAVTLPRGQATNEVQSPLTAGFAVCESAALGLLRRHLLSVNQGDIFSAAESGSVVIAQQIPKRIKKADAIYSVFSNPQLAATKQMARNTDFVPSCGESKNVFWHNIVSGKQIGSSEDVQLVFS